MKFNKYLCFLSMLCLIGSAKSNANAGLPSLEDGNRPNFSDTLSIGDLIPQGIQFESVLNSEEGFIRLDDFRGKYLVLQFWAPTCSSSISALPKMNDLHKKFGEKIAFLPITVFHQRQVDEVLKGYAAVRDINLPLVVEAKGIMEYFPHSVIPHYVILNPEGKVVAITGMEDLNAANLESLLQGELVFRKKEDIVIELPAEEKLISESPQIKNKNIWLQSAFTGYIPGLGGSLIQNYEGMSHIRIVNMSLLYHFQLAYSEKNLKDYFGRNRIELIGFDVEELWTDKMGLDYLNWMAEGTHVFGYELIAPPSMDPYALMREDLKRFVPHIEASIETRTKKVYALIRQEENEFPASRSVERTYKAGPLGVKMTRYPLEGFVYHLNAYFMSQSPYPVIDRTGIDFPIDLSLKASLSDFESLSDALKPHGLDLVEREEEIPVLVLRKISNPKLLAP